jgi:hypothetical protein
MNTIVVERDFVQPITVGDLHALARALKWCTDLHRVAPTRWRYLAMDGSRCACVYTAPDLEAVRLVLRSSTNGPPKRLWTTRTYEASPGEEPEIPPGFSLVLVERTLPEPIRVEDIPSLAARCGGCFEMYRVRFIRCHLAMDGLRMLCLYVAPDLEAVRYGNKRAGMPFDTMWAATLVPPVAYDAQPSFALAAG